MQKTRLLLLSLALLATACGFQLRGTLSGHFEVENIHIRAAGAAQLGQALKFQLAGAGVTLADNAEDAACIVDLKAETFDKSVLSVSARTGKVEEYRILFSARMDVFKAGGQVLARDELIQQSRDQIVDAGAVLGNFSEESLIREELARGAAAQAARRLQALLSRPD